MVVVEEEDPLQPDFGVENPLSMDAPQVLDESPKSNPDISSDGWVDEGQGKLPARSQNTVGEQLEGLNPSNGSLENSGPYEHEESSEDAKSEGCMDEELHTPAEHSIVLELKSLFEEQTTVVLEQKEDPICPEMQDEYSHDVAHSGSLMLVNPSEMGLGFVAEQSLPFQELELSGCEGGYEGMKVIGQCYEVLLTLSAPRKEGGWLTASLYCSRWKTLKLLLYENHGWKWAKFSSFIVFDLGKLRSPLYGRAEASPSQRRKLLQALFTDIAREIDDRATI